MSLLSYQLTSMNICFQTTFIALLADLRCDRIPFFKIMNKLLVVSAQRCYVNYSIVSVARLPLNRMRTTWSRRWRLRIQTTACGRWTYSERHLAAIFTRSLFFRLRLIFIFARKLTVCHYRCSPGISASLGRQVCGRNVFFKVGRCR